MPPHPSSGTALSRVAEKSLGLAARFWFSVAFLGQGIFVAYLAAFYGRSALRGDLNAWNKVLPHGHVPGDTVGNAAIAAHIALAALILIGGPLQLIPQVRSRFPAFHRWLGRVYMVAVSATSLVGLFMVWFKGGVGSTVQHLGISLDAVLILVFAALAVRHAMARDFDAHRRWALRLFMVVSAVWFFRVGLMFWIAVNKGPAGFDPKTFTGPFLNVLSFAQYLLPLAVLELYFRAKAKAGTPGRFAMAGGLVVLTLAMGFGIAIATLGMWLPHM